MGKKNGYSECEHKAYTNPVVFPKQTSIEDLPEIYKDK